MSRITTGSLARRVGALEAAKGLREAWRYKPAADMTDEELLQAMFESGKLGWDISLFPGETLAERADAADRVLLGELEVSEGARYAARDWFACSAALHAGLSGEAYDRFVVQWIAERYGPAATRGAKDLTDEELIVELARLEGDE